MNDIMRNLQTTLQRIADAQAHYGQTSPVTLLPISKGQSIAALSLLIQSGQYAFGENTVQEALEKISAFHDKPITWHFIGVIQSNKTKILAQKFSWVHTVSQLAHAQLLSRHRPAYLPPLNICLQIHLDPQKKAGVSFEEALALGIAIQTLPGLWLRGLMGIAPHTCDKDIQRHSFRQLRVLRDTFNNNGFSLDTLSMGMTDDLEAAIAEGATLVRVGSGIFGNGNKGQQET